MDKKSYPPFCEILLKKNLPENFLAYINWEKKKLFQGPESFLVSAHWSLHCCVLWFFVARFVQCGLLGKDRLA